MKALVVTSQNAINYGAVLQSYAFHQWLKEQQIDNVLLDLKRASPVYVQKLVLNANFPGQLYDLFLRIIYFPEIRRKVRRFEEFIADHIATTRLYDTIQAVIDDPPQADVYITGGDQMFNIHAGIRPTNFLFFGSKDTKRVSYSTSMGMAAVPKVYMERFVSLLNKYSLLSLREESAAKYLSQVCNVPCRTNIDPVFLLTKEQWNNVIPVGDKKQGKYILVYPLLYNANTNAVIKRLKALTGLRVMIISQRARNYAKGGKVIRDAGPSEFLHLFRDAEYVVTTSFHGTCLAILYEKKFFSLIRESGEVRINALLEKLELQDRIIKDPGEVSTREICFNRAQDIINIERTRAKEYIEEIFSE